jgi:HEPN domain-containing protein
MPPDPGSPAEWLRYARSDLALAKRPAGGELMLEGLCFHAQQAAEKSIKAVLIDAGVAFPKVHSIERLIDLLPPSIARTPELAAAAQLTAYATTFRYPGIEEPVSEDQYQEALRTAEAVVAWATALLGRRNAGWSTLT